MIISSSTQYSNFNTSVLNHGLLFSLLFYLVVYFAHSLTMKRPGNYYEKFVAVEEQGCLQLIFDNRAAIKCKTF